MTREGLWSETEAGLIKVYSKPLRNSDFARGAEILKELESKRKTALLEGHISHVKGGI